MSRQLLTHGLTAVAFLALGYLLFGRGPTPAEVQAAIDRADRAETLAAQNTQIAAHWIGLAHGYRLASDSLERLAQKPRSVVRHSVDTVEVMVREGDTAGALLEARRGLAACGEAFRLDSLALVVCRASGLAKDSALAVLGVTVDSLRAANRGATGVLRRVREKPWALGPTYGASGWGVELGRDLEFLLPLRVTVSGTREEVRAGLNVRF